MKIRLDRTICDGFGMCAKRAPKYFSLDDWGYASLNGGNQVDEADRDAVMRALLDCPVHAITESAAAAGRSATRARDEAERSHQEQRRT